MVVWQILIFTTFISFMHYLHKFPIYIVNLVEAILLNFLRAEIMKTYTSF